MHFGRPGPLRPPPGFVLGATVGVCHQSLARPQLIINHEPITIYEYFEKKRKEKKRMQIILNPMLVIQHCLLIMLIYQFFENFNTKS